MGVQPSKIEDMVAIHATMTAQWKASSHYHLFVNFLTNTILPLQNLRLDTALSMSLGELSNREEHVGPKPNYATQREAKLAGKGPKWRFDDAYEQRCLGRLTQLVAFETWLEVLRRFLSLFLLL